MSRDWAAIILKLGAAIACLAVAYYFAFHLPGREAVRAQANEAKVSSYRECVETADTVHSVNWTAACRSIGLEWNCSLSSDDAERITRQLETDRAQCLAEAKAGVGTLATAAE